MKFESMANRVVQCEASGSIDVFYQRLGKLQDRCAGYSTFVQVRGSAFSEEYSFFRKNVDLPVLDVDTNEIEYPEVCFLVEGLARNSEIKSAPLPSEKILKMLDERSSRCGKKFSLVLGEKQKSEGLPGWMGDYICLHLPLEKVIIEADHRQAILRLLMDPIDERKGHLHYGVSGDPSTECVLHKSQARVM